jgi:transposase
MRRCPRGSEGIFYGISPGERRGNRLGFVRAEPARPGCDPRDLLKLYLYGYLQQVRSSRRLEAECQRNVEVMWLLGRLQPDYKSIAEFRRIHSQAVSDAGAELVRFARSVGLVRGETVAVDGSKFQAVSSAHHVRERDAVKRYLEQLDTVDAQDEMVVDPSVVQAGEAEERSATGSTLPANRQGFGASLQRADRR